MLTGTDKNWPYTTTGGNGISTGTFISNNRSAPNGVAVFCKNCHDLSATNVHTETSAHNIACVNCHIRVPHGGKVSRLISTTNVYARYRPDGAAGGTNPSVTSFTKAAPNGYQESNCQAGCTTKHNSAATESW
jgi:hypothetical protein